MSDTPSIICARRKLQFYEVLNKNTSASKENVNLVIYWIVH